MNKNFPYSHQMQYESNQFTQQNLYSFQANLLDLRNLMQQLLSELDSISNYMLNRLISNDISLEELNNVNEAITRFKQNLTLESTNNFLNTLRGYISKRGYNSLTPYEKFRIYTDKVAYGYSQVELENKYFTYQSVISKVLKEFEDANRQNPYSSDLNTLNFPQK